jgi:type IV pilus assembly protein PilV
MMRSNKDIALITTSAGGNPYLFDFKSGTTALPSTSSDCFNAACATTLAVAQFNVKEWLTRVNAALPGVRVVVCYDDAPYDATTGLPSWGCPAVPPANAPAVVKIGWTQRKLDSSATDVERATGVGSGAGRPIVILPLIAGSTT